MQMDRNTSTERKVTYTALAVALGGPIGQDLTITNETRTNKNPTHSKVTELQKRVINVIKKQILNGK